MTAKRSCLKRADVDPARRPCSPICDRLARCRPGCPGWWRTGSPSRPGSTASGTFGAGEHARGSGAPSRRRPRRRRDRRPRRAPARPASGAFLAFGTSYQSGSSTPALASTRRSAGSPSPSVFAACATTATFMTPAGIWPRRSDGRRSGPVPAGARRRRRRGTRTAAPAPRRCRSARPPPTSSGWCMPRYMRETATNSGSSSATTQAATRQRPFGNADVSSSTRPQ